MTQKLSVKDIPLNGKKILMRVDFNVPLQGDGTISDDSRIRESLPTIKYILDQKASLILMSHLGRPKGKKDPAFTLAPCAKRLSELLHKPVAVAQDCIGPQVEKLAASLKAGEVLLLENLRFYDAEENPDQDPSFAEKLAILGNVYVNDAFGAAHRKHSSTYTIAKYFPGLALAGLLMEKEISFLGSLVKNPKRPFYAILGGAKVSTKVGVIQHLIEKIDGLFIGGAMAFTFLKAQGLQVGASLVEDSELETTKHILKKCQDKKIPCHLPLDLVIADSFKNEAKIRTVGVKEGFSAPWQGMDIGPKTAAEWKNNLSKAATVFWNGPLGAFEMSNFSKGTHTVADILAASKAVTIVGGGDSVAAINQLGLSSKFTHLSTGGGASLEYIEFGHLPGIDALSDRKNAK